MENPDYNTVTKEQCEYETCTMLWALGAGAAVLKQAPSIDDISLLEVRFEMLFGQGQKPTTPRYAWNGRGSWGDSIMKDMKSYEASDAMFRDGNSCILD